MDGIRYWIETESGGHYFFVAFPAILLCLFIWFKGQRIRFLIPSVLITVIIVNPVFYKIWDELGLYAYWRILWIIPVIPILAAFVPSLTDLMKNKWLKAVIVTFGLSLVMLGGTFLYSGNGGTFVEAANAAKLPDDVTAVADRLLELDDHPRIVAQNPIGVYIRQYTGEIDTLFGRDVDGYIYKRLSINSGDAYRELRNPESCDYSVIRKIMLNDGYKYLVIDNSSEFIKEKLEGNHFEFVDRVNQYAIYITKGLPTEIKRKNELGQVVSITTVNDDGKAIRSSKGYATVQYEYDENGNIQRGTFYDIDDHITTSVNGYSSFLRTHDKKGNVIRETYYDENSKKTECIYGYVSLVRTYDSEGNVLRESYFDANDAPCYEKNGFASIEREYDQSGNVKRQIYFSIDGMPVEIYTGFAEVRRTYDSNRNILSENYFDIFGNPCVLEAGYSAFVQEFDEYGSLLSRTYLGEDGNPIQRTDGYSQTRWEKTEEGVTTVEFYDSAGNLISNDGLNLVKDVTGTSGWSRWITPGYNTKNYYVGVGSVNLGNKQAGDVYTCKIEIEFSDVLFKDSEDFWFRTQGPVDQAWYTRSIWQDLIVLNEPPTDGVYEYITSIVLDDDMARASTFDLGFSCNRWEKGSFRVKNVKIEKGETSSSWTPGL